MNLKYNYKNGFLVDSEAFFVCPCSFDLGFLNLSDEFVKIKFSFLPSTVYCYIFLNTLIPKICR